MSMISRISAGNPASPPMPERRVQVKLGEKILPTAEAIEELAAEPGKMDLYVWYEGTQGLCEKTAIFYENFLSLLAARKMDITWCPYSLVGWGGEKTVAKMPPSSKIGESMARIDPRRLRCVQAVSFFRNCLNPNPSLSNYVSETLPKKERLWQLSQDRKKSGMSVANFFDNKPSLFNCLRTRLNPSTGREETVDIKQAYSLMENIEGYYLIRDSVQQALARGERSVKVAFLLPNNEGAYYFDYQEELEKMLKAEFGDSIAIDISFRFFKYGETDDDRPYIVKDKRAKKVEPDEVASYWSFVRPPIVPRDIIHNLNG